MTIAEKLAAVGFDYRPLTLKERGKVAVWLSVNPGERREKLMQLVGDAQVRHTPSGLVLVRAK